MPATSDPGNVPGAEEALLETSAECTVTVDNTQLRYSISQVRLEQHIDRHHDLTVTIKQVGEEAGRDGLLDPSEYRSLLGKSISVAVRPVGEHVDASRAGEFIGVVTRVTMLNSIDGVNTILINAKSPTIALDGARRNAFYREQSATDVIGAILQKYPITVGTVDSASGELKYSVQYRETDFQYVMRLAGGAGMFAFYDGREFRVVQPTSADTEELVWRETLGSFALGLGAEQSEFATQLYNYEQKRNYDQDTSSLPPGRSLSDMSQIAPDASKEIFGDSSFSSSAHVVADAQSLDTVLLRDRSRAMGRMITCVGKSIVPNVAVGHTVRIAGLGQLEGEYLVRSVAHVLDERGRYRNTFECTPLDMAFPQAFSARPAITNLQTGVVVDNNDPDQLGRLKVKFPWLESDETPWVRFMTLHAGEERGWYALPEIDDEVLVGYEFGSPDYPIVLGALYNSEAIPPADGPEAENNVKLFKTKGGNQITLKDKSGSEQISITTKDGDNSLVLDMSGPSISITSKGDISIKGKNVKIESEQEITVKAGSNAKIEASANLETKAGANYKAQGAMMAVEGQGPVDIKGAIIKLN